MDHKDIQGIIAKILWGKSFVDVKDGDKRENTFILRSLSIKESNFSKYIYNKEFDNAIKLGILTFNELKNIYIENNVWSDKQENRISNIDIDIAKANSQIKDAEFFTIKKKKLIKQLKKLETEKKELLELKNSLFVLSAENRAEEIMRRWIVMMSTENTDELPYWKNKDCFLEETDSCLIYNLAIAYYRNNIFDEKTLRLIARHPEWRFRWANSKNGADLFGRSIADYSEMQNLLVYWSQYYDFVFESNAPDNIVDNDEACDIWVKDENKRLKHGNKNTQNKNVFGNRKATTKKDHAEQFIMVQPGDKKAIKKVHEMNTSSIRRQLQNENKKIKSSRGRLTDFQLRGNICR